MGNSCVINQNLSIEKGHESYSDSWHQLGGSVLEEPITEIRNPKPQPGTTPPNSNNAEPVGRTWSELGGDDLEEPLTKGRVKLVRAEYLLRLANFQEKLPPSHLIPPEEVVSLEELKEADPGRIKFDAFDLDEEWLRIIVVSAPWLAPDHPDPKGRNLSLIARALQAFLDESADKTYGVLMDFTSLPQGPEAEDRRFVQSTLPALSLFYSHPHTVVLKVTTLPDGYPDSYRLPAGANTMAYAKRGWCYAESLVSSLAKSSGLVLDLGKFPAHSPHLWHIIHKCGSERSPPLSLDIFKRELRKKTFANAEVDLPKAEKLYSHGFQRHIEQAKELDYSGLGWGPEALRQLSGAVESNRHLRSLNLEKNRLGPKGAGVLASALQQCNSSIVDLNLGHNAILAAGAKTLGEALKANRTLRTLNLQDNDIGEEGAKAIASALDSRNCALTSLNLSLNFIGAEGGDALCNALKCNQSLTSLDLSMNVLGDGATKVAEALQSNSTLTSLNLQHNGAPPSCARALATALSGNTALTELNLQDNYMGDEGAKELGKALHTNGRLCSLNLERNSLGHECEESLQEAVAGKEVNVHT